MSCLTIKLYLNLFINDQNIFGFSLKVFGNLPLPSEIFGNLLKFSENIQKRSCGLWTIFWKSLEIFGKWSEIFGELSKMLLPVCLYNKQNNAWLLEDMEDLFTC